MTLAMLIVTSATLGQALLSLVQLASRRRRRGADAPLALALSAIAVVLATAALSAIPGADRGVLFSLSLPAWLTLAPALSLYVEALTAEDGWRPASAHARRFLLAGLALAAVPLMLALSPEERRIMTVEGRSPGEAMAQTVGMALFVLIVAGTVSAGIHGSRGLRRLTLYRARLEALFADNDRRELRWLWALGSVMAAAWLLALIALAADSLSGAAPVLTAMAQGLGLAAAWALSLLGLRQTPGFEGREVEPALADAVVEAASPPVKYSRSALTPEQAERTAARIEAAMRDERLYLDPALSLPALSARLRLSPNLVSQTLNERLGASFFAYVNGWRARAAAPLVLAGDKTTLEIALEVGFNSKSAFYKAFKAAFGTSPARYRPD